MLLRLSSVSNLGVPWSLASVGERVHLWDPRTVIFRSMLVAYLTHINCQQCCHTDKWEFNSTELRERRRPFPFPNDWPRCRNTRVPPWITHLLPAWNDHARTSSRKDQTFLLLPTRCISPPIHDWDSMDTSANQFVGRLRDASYPPLKLVENSCANLHDDLHYSRTFASSVHQLSWMGHGFHGSTNGAHDEVVLARLQSL